MSARHCVEAGEPRRDAARRRRRCRRPRGRTNRSRTSPRAARAAGCAWRDRTSCRRRAWPRRHARRSLAQRASWRLVPLRPARCANRRRSRPRATVPAPSASARRFAEMHALAQRIAASAGSRPGARPALDDRDFQRQPAYRRCCRQSRGFARAAPPVRARQLAQAMSQSAAARGLSPSASTPSAVRGQRIERDIDAVEVAIVLARNPADG